MYTVYKSDVSYFSGKLEAFLRYKEISHNLVDCDRSALLEIAANTGTQKMPAIKMDDGRWLYDTTPMMQWLDARHPAGQTYPQDPALRFVALLLEDYADEWLWRPAMWWRWVPRASRVALGRRIAGDLLSKRLAIPLGYLVGRRQLDEWLWKDGANPENSHAIRDMLFHELEFLEAVLANQPFILGSHASIADFGYFASMFRHFGNDPVSAEVVRRRGPNTHEWLARLWNRRYSELSDRIDWNWPDAAYWQPLLRRISTDYLPYLHQNALAFSAGSERFDYSGDTFSLKGTKTTFYRVWCRQQLQREFAQLSDQDRSRVNNLFEDVGGLYQLDLDGEIESTIEISLPVDASKGVVKPGWRRWLLGQARN